MKTIYVVAALIRSGERLFATQRGYGDLKGVWEFPGGKVQEGESPQEALEREIREELDTTIRVGKLYKTIEYDYPTFHLVMDCFWCSVVEGDLSLQEHMNSAWLTRETLRTVSWAPADEQLIDDFETNGFAIKNLVFDVGHILFSYRWKDMFLDYGLSLEDSLRVGESVFSFPSWTEKFDRGTATCEDMIEEFRQAYPDDIEAIIWFLKNAKQMRVDRKEIWEKVGQLKEQGYHIYLLSNYSKYLFDLHTEDDCFLQYLDGKVVSYEPQMVKPEPGIYQYLFKKYDLKAEECLFFDDRYENVVASHEQGMDALFITSREMLDGILGHLLD